MASTEGIKRTSSPEESAMAAPPVPLGDLLDDTSRFDGGVLDTPFSEEGSVLGEREEELTDEHVSDDEGDEELYGGDDDDDDDWDDYYSESEDDDEPLELGDGDAAGNDDSVEMTMEFVDFLPKPAWFATVENTAGFMRITAAEAEAGQEGAGGEIIVLYRCTRFSRAWSWSGGHCGADMRRSRPEEHHARFLVPSLAADPATSLRLAGASLASLVCHGRFRDQLHDLWSSLVAAAPVTVPPRATRVDVIVDVGILRRGDCTPERMAHMLMALPAVANKVDSWPALEEFDMELHLPAMVRLDDDDGARPTKRRRVAGEECPICYEVLEKGVAAWPGCCHVFHGRCLEKLLLKGNQRCPMCRATCSIEESYGTNA
ncbi:hypothetical protein ACP70R_028603 [Stipagrostis hirtigluma subsp. patula]